MKFEEHIEINEEDLKAVDVLAKSCEFTKQMIKQVMSKGAVWLTREQNTRRIRRADKILKPGDTLHLYYDEKVLSKNPEDPILIADEGIYSIWYKPYGMLSQGSKWGDHCTINRWIEKNLQPQRPAFVVHRLDRAATGLIIIAHQKKIAAYFSKLFQERQIEKHYQAIVHGEFSEDLTLNSEINDKPALSHAKLLIFNESANQSLVEVSIETGRKHQIRRHLSEAGFPIVGDRLYGKEDDDYEKDLCLASCYLSFNSPSSLATDDSQKIYTLPEHLSVKF